MKWLLLTLIMPLAPEGGVVTGWVNFHPSKEACEDAKWAAQVQFGFAQRGGIQTTYLMASCQKAEPK